METSLAAGVAKVVTAGYFVGAGIEASAVENIGVDMGFELYSEEERRQSFVGSRQCKVAEIGNAKKLRTDLGEQACKSRVTASALGCNTYGRWPGWLSSCATPPISPRGCV